MGEKPQQSGDPDDSDLFAGDSPRWRDANAERTSEAKRRRDDRPAPTSDADGAIDHRTDPPGATKSNDER
jgi:hypothetical protein